MERILSVKEQKTELASAMKIKLPPLLQRFPFFTTQHLTLYLSIGLCTTSR